MAGMLSGVPSHHGAPEGIYNVFQEKLEEGGRRWYFSRREIEEDSPSRQDGIDLKKETYLRKSYCTFLQDLGMRLKVPQVTIATAIIFCHRFFLRQSHARNDRRTIATVCMFLAGKVEETPRPLKDVILVSYEIIHKKDAAAVQRIKQKEVYEQQKELVLLGERVVLATLGFDFNLIHPYKPLVEAIKKFQVAQNTLAQVEKSEAAQRQNTLAQVAWNFVNDGLRTSLCLQFKPHHIAAGAIFLAAKFLTVKLPSEGEKVWWQEFDVTPRQLEEVSNQMLELYEQNRVPPSRNPTNEEHVTSGTTSKASSQKPARPVPDQSLSKDHSEPSRSSQTRNNGHRSSEINSFQGGMEDNGINNIQHHKREEEMQSKSRVGKEGHGKDDDDDGEANSGRMEANKKLDPEKLKAAFKRRKAQGETVHKMDPTDELERELEDIELPPERKQNLSKPSNTSENETCHQNEAGERNHQAVEDSDTVEEGEVEPSDGADRGYRSPTSGTPKRKPGSPLDGQMEGNQPTDYAQGSHQQNGLGRHGYSEKGT